MKTENSYSTTDSGNIIAINQFILSFMSHEPHLQMYYGIHDNRHPDQETKEQEQQRTDD